VALQSHRDTSLTLLFTLRQANKYDSFELYTQAMPKRKKGETSRAETLEWLCRQMKSPEIYMARAIKDPKYTRPANLQELVVDCEVAPDQNRTSE
jgi:hypothetical protein